MADCLALEVLNFPTNALSFGWFQFCDILDKRPRHTVDSRADIEVQDGVGYFSVKV